MDGFGTSSYGDAFADVYDRWYRDVTDVDACVACLHSLAPDAQPVLELGVGTGRLAIPLAATGLTVTGVDASTAMLDGLRSKPGAEQVATSLGDMADLSGATPALPEAPTFGLAFVAYNTLFNLGDDDAVGRCVLGVARRLRPGGRFVVEAFVPLPDPDGRHDGVAVSRLDATEVVLTATLHDPDSRTITGQHVQITEAGIRLRPWVVHYLTPEQLDSVATDAGLELEHRWSDWAGAPFEVASSTHVSVYRRPL